MLDFEIEEKSSWEKLKESGKPTVIYGMGNGADKVIDELNRLSVPILGVTASDDFVRGQMFRGFRVKKLSEFSGDFNIAVAFASCLPEVMNHIYSLCEKYRVLVPCVPVFGDEIFNRSFIEANESEINAAYALFDEKSKEIFAGCVNFMFGGELETLRAVTSEKSEVFGGFFRLGSDESYLDLGAYRGDTVEEFLNNCGGEYESITAVEPDRRSFAKLCDYLENVPDSTAFRKVIFSESGTLRFGSRGGRQSAIAGNGEEAEAVTVDELCHGRKVTYIKMDVEGAEAEAIKGAWQTIKTRSPKLNIALYHRSRDIFALPLLIASINPNYGFHLRRHPYIPCWDMNLYCVSE